MTSPVQLWIADEAHHNAYAYTLAAHMLGDTGIIEGAIYTHPNFFILHAEEDGKDITLEPTRRLLSFCKTTPAYKMPRLIAIPHADTLNRQAANALLKVMEEPPKNTFVVLLTDSPAKILPTLLSRCTQVRLQCTQDAYAWIAHYPPAPHPHPKASLLSRDSDTTPTIQGELSSMLGKLILMILTGGYERAHSMIDDLSDKAEDSLSCQKLIEHALHFFNTLIRAPYTGSPLSAGHARMFDLYPHAHWLCVYEACSAYTQDAKVAHIPVRDQLRGIVMLAKAPHGYMHETL